MVFYAYTKMANKPFLDRYKRGTSISEMRAPNTQGQHKDKLRHVKEC